MAAETKMKYNRGAWLPLILEGLSIGQKLSVFMGSIE